MTVFAAEWLHALGSAAPDEHDVKALLRGYAIETPRGVRLAPGAPLPTLDFPAPYVVKVCSARVLHKTEHRGVVLRVGEAELAAALSAMRERFPGEAVIVEEQVTLDGTEIIVGALVDGELGPAVMVGAGGILTEIYRDVTFRLAPCPAEEARRMLQELRIAPLFSGFRGSTLDPKSLAELIARVGELTVDLGERFHQLDINPLAWVGGRWLALDAKLLLQESTAA
jgi:succinyl-CoA synthetase beta subunit